MKSLLQLLHHLPSNSLAPKGYKVGVGDVINFSPGKSYNIWKVIEIRVDYVVAMSYDTESKQYNNPGWLNKELYQIDAIYIEWQSVTEEELIKASKYKRPQD